MSPTFIHVYHSKIQDSEEIEKILKSIGYVAGPKDSILKKSYEFHKYGCRVMLRFYSREYSAPPSSLSFSDRGRIIAIRGAEEDIKKVREEIQKDESKELLPEDIKLYREEIRKLI